MDKINGVKLKKLLIDKMFLVISAFGVGVCIFIFLWFLFNSMINEDWIFFIIESIAYVFLFIYGINKTFGLKKKVRNIVSFLLLIFFAVFPIIAGFTVFYFKFLPFPKRNFISFSIVLFLVITFVLCFDQCLKFLERRKHSTTTKKEKNLNDL